jgi:suppressor for copper-sensitivity B
MTKLSTFCRAFALLLAVLALSPAAFAQGEVTVSATLSADQVPAGSSAVIAVVFDHQPGWHTWPSLAQDVLPSDIAKFAIRTEVGIDPKPAQIAAVFPTQWPEPHDSPVANPLGDPLTIEVATYSGRAVFYIPIKLADDASGRFTIPVKVSLQACDDAVCLMPENLDREVSVTVGDLTNDQLALGAGDFQGFDSAIFDLDPATLPDPTSGAQGPGGKGPMGIILLILASALGGFILNLTPCVLPVIPLKVMAISSHAETPGKTMYLGLWMAAGVVAFWFGIGLPVAVFAGVFDPSRLFGIWWFTLAIGLVIGVMAIGVMGAFTINLPQKAYMFNPKADSALGSFLFGLMTAVLGLPCFGFVAGALLVGLATLPSMIVILIFTAIGVGMAAPYLVLAAKPDWVKKIPRTGPASELIKQIMGLLLLGAAAFFVGAGVLAFIGGRPSMVVAMPWWGKQVHVWLIALAGLAAGGWLTLRTFQITKSLPRRITFSVVGLVIAGFATLYAGNSTLKGYHNFWIPFTQEAMDQAIAEGQIVVVDFTAEWCLNCKVIEATVLNPQPVKGKLLASHVVPLVADLTSTKAPGWDKLKELGRTGIPYLAIFAGDAETPFWSSNAYTSAQVMDAFARAEESLGIAVRTADADSAGP